MNSVIQVSQEVADALAQGRPVVALETSIVGQGLPAPHNLRAAHESEAAIRTGGAVPASVAVLDGKIAAIGVAQRHGVTLHGFAVNLQPNLSHFESSDYQLLGAAGGNGHVDSTPAPAPA